MAENLIPNLVGQVRDTRGKQAAKHMRQEGRIPAVLYHSNDDKTVSSIALDFAEKDIRTLVAHRPALINVSWGSGKDDSRECILRDVQRHPVTHIPMHLDLLGIQRGVKMDSSVQLRLEGTPIGVKDQGGILQQTLYELAIRCLPKDLVNEFVVDVSELELHDSIHVKDLESETLEFTDELDRTVATVAVPRVHVEEAEEAEGEEGEEGEEAEAAEGEEAAEAGGGDEESTED